MSTPGPSNSSRSSTRTIGSPGSAHAAPMSLTHSRRVVGASVARRSVAKIVARRSGTPSVRTPVGDAASVVVDLTSGVGRFDVRVAEQRHPGVVRPVPEEYLAISRGAREETREPRDFAADATRGVGEEVDEPRAAARRGVVFPGAQSRDRLGGVGGSLGE